MMHRFNHRVTAIRLTPFAFGLVCLVFWGTKTEASWLIDAKRFHASAHGQISCQECHYDVQDMETHPNPKNVVKRRTDFFDPDRCIECHEDVEERLDEGWHGERKVENRGKYEYCIRCHKPHHQRRLGENRIGKFVSGRPRHEQCGACHEEQNALPALSDEDETCMVCHLLVDPATDKGRERGNRLCLYCHADKGTDAQKTTGAFVPLIDLKAYATTAHSNEACLSCHVRGAAYSHAAQPLGDCRQCHVLHDEKVAHAAHMRVACGSCHLQQVRPVINPREQVVGWRVESELGVNSRIHHMRLGEDESSCERCHFKGNDLGAATMILPAKSIICMPCHAATFSVGDTTTIITLLIFLGGVVLFFSYWLSGSIAEVPDDRPVSKLFRMVVQSIRAILSWRIFLIAKSMILDVLLQRRLYRQSRARWFIHSMIFLPFVFRFTWGICGLIGSLAWPEGQWPWILINKNHPLTAFLFDLSGVMIIFGLLLAFVRGFVKEMYQAFDASRQDRIALGLVGAIVVVGFILEAMRIAMTGRPDGSGYALVGYVLSFLMPESKTLTGIYGYVWYIHAIISGAFIAYIPFSRLSHIIMGPVVLAMNAASGERHAQG
jgi:nitrate reductase gamma subunit